MVTFINNNNKLTLLLDRIFYFSTEIYFMKHYFIKTIQCFCLFTTTALISQEVNPFNGSLNYGVPLLSVPSDRGNAIPITISYGGNGIAVTQPASEVGLGWGLSAGGSIIRSVSGIPDDFNGPIFNQKTKTFVTQRGVLSSSGPTHFDILTSRRNLDSTQFYYPNYDSYSVNGPGIGGSMTPLLLSYMAFSKNSNGEFVYDSNNSSTWKQPQFIFNGDFADTLVSRHYQSSPVDGSTTYHLPKDYISGDCHNDDTPYFGKRGNGTGGNCEENYNLTTNRLGTSNYVEYAMNSYGISSFTITNSAGFVYRYELPVYSNSTINYSYPLNNDYSIPKYTASGVQDTKVGSASQYYVEHTYPNSGGTYVTEIKESNKIPVEWKLTSITGPDYVDLGSAGFDASDRGYWVTFEYKLWSQNFYTRYPVYGFNYYFGNDDETAHYPINDVKKRSGKFASASLNNEEVYYLNSVKTSSHKAIIIRDVRNDEVGANPIYDGSLNDSLLISPSGTVTALQGRVFDEGGASGGYVSCVSSSSDVTTTNFMKTIQLGNINSLVLKFNLLDLNKCQVGGNFRYDNLHIYAGPDDTYPEITFTHNSVNYTSPFNSSPYNNPPVVPTGTEITLNNFTATSITFKIEKFCVGGSQYFGNGFDIEWHAIANKKTPQLFVKRVLLYNNDFSSNSIFTNVNSLSSANANFDFTTTTNATAPPFNETWYQSNKTLLEGNLLKGNLLEYDYSLSKNYHKNIDVQEYRTSRLSSPANIQSNLTINSNVLGTGKLTLNKIVPIEYQGYQLYPSVKFEYNSSNTNDNPNYDPRKTDYWGYYKNDVSSLGYYGYTTPTSKDYTDAWMLRKITSPLGGITELEYESNSYSKVIKGNGGFRGPVRLYPVEKVVNGSVHLEEGTNLPEDLAAVYNSTAATSYSPELFLPLIAYPFSGGVNSNDISNLYGNFTYSYNGTTPLPLNPSFTGKFSMATVGNPVFTSCTSPSVVDLNYVVDDVTFKYTGNGWIRFTLPVSTSTVYGAGSRVKKIISKNGTKDSYTTLFEYEDGVALNEADRFTNPIARYASHASCGAYEKLSPFGADRFELSASVGYSKSKTKVLGQINAEKGWTESYFITSDLSNFLNEEIDNYKTYLTPKANYTHTIVSSPYNCSRIDTGSVVEYVDKFSPFWGLTKEQRVYDVNGNILNKSVYDYETTSQGAVVENFVFTLAQNVYVWTNPGSPGPCVYFEGENALYQTCIKRQYPAVLKRTTSYGMGTKSITETLKRDELTGEGTVIQVSADNNTSALSIKVPAFRFAPFANMGAKSVNSSYKNVLGAEGYYYSVIDSNLTTASGSSSNFAGASANVYSQNALTRSYNQGTNTYANSSITLPYWFNKSSYSWTGDVGSIDTYGLYKKSELSANPFNFSNPSSSNSKWRFGGEISLLDDKGHTIETRGFNNKFSASKIDYTGKYLISQITNCNYLSFTYTGFEYYSGLGMTDGEVNMPTSNSFVTIPAFGAHTGGYAALVNASGMGPNYSVTYNGTGTNGEELGLMRNRIYRASVWTHTSSATGSKLVVVLDGSVNSVPYSQTVSMAFTDAKAITVGAWKLLSVDIKVPADYVSTGGTLNKFITYLEVQGGGTGYFDDFQVHPIESNVASKVYDITNGRILADINSEGYATKYVYDFAGRIISLYQEIPGVGLKLIKSNTYNYARGTN